MMTSERLVEVYEPEQFELDGSIEQREELAQIVGELNDESQRIRDAGDWARSILRSMMLNVPKPVYSVRTPMYVVRLKKLIEARCATHGCPPYACFTAHPEALVPITEMELGRYFSIERRGHESEDIAP
jgi:hypothetical protein